MLGTWCSPSVCWCWCWCGRNGDGPVMVDRGRAGALSSMHMATRESPHWAARVIRLDQNVDRWAARSPDQWAARSPRAPLRRRSGRRRRGPRRWSQSSEQRATSWGESSCSACSDQSSGTSFAVRVQCARRGPPRSSEFRRAVASWSRLVVSCRVDRARSGPIGTTRARSGRPSSDRPSSDRPGAGGS